MRTCTITTYRVKSEYRENEGVFYHLVWLATFKTDESQMGKKLMKLAEENRKAPFGATCMKVVIQEGEQRHAVKRQYIQDLTFKTKQTSWQDIPFFVPNRAEYKSNKEQYYWSC